MKRFYKHLSTWMFTSIFLMVLFFVLRIPPWISLVVVAGWGMAIAAEAFDVFGFPGMDPDWEERKIQEEMDKMAEFEAPVEPDLEQMSDSEKEDLEDDLLELDDFKQLRKDWKDSDFV